MKNARVALFVDSFGIAPSGVSIEHECEVASPLEGTDPGIHDAGSVADGLM